MRTPFGAECPHYYGDFHRGRNVETCRLLGLGDGADKWRSSLCSKCAVPRLVMANACPSLRLHGRVSAGFLGFGRRMLITASCVRSGGAVVHPEVGCGLCHEAQVGDPKGVR